MDSLRVSKLEPDIFNEFKDVSFKECKTEAQILDWMLSLLVSFLSYSNKDLLQLRALVKSRYAFNVLFPVSSEEITEVCSHYFEDISTLTMCRLINRYIAMKGNIYLINSEFFSFFRKIKLDKIQIKHLPLNTVGYVKLPVPISDGDMDEIDSFYFYLGDEQEFVQLKDSDEYEDYLKLMNERAPKYKNASNNMISLGWRTKKLAFSYIHFPLPTDNDLSIQEYLQDSKHTYRVAPNIDPIVTQEDGFQPHIAIMLNIVAYINSGDPDLRQFKNNFRYQSKGSSKLVKADKVLSKSDICLLGFGWKKLPIYQKENWYVGPYWATRYKNKIPQLTLCKGSFRERKTNGN